MESVVKIDESFQIVSNVVGYTHSTYIYNLVLYFKVTGDLKLMNAFMCFPVKQNLCETAKNTSFVVFIYIYTQEFERFFHDFIHKLTKFFGKNLNTIQWVLDLFISNHCSSFPKHLSFCVQIINCIFKCSFISVIPFKLYRCQTLSLIVNICAVVV